MRPRFYGTRTYRAHFLFHHPAYTIQKVREGDYQSNETIVRAQVGHAVRWIKLKLQYGNLDILEFQFNPAVEESCSPFLPNEIFLDFIGQEG